MVVLQDSSLILTRLPALWRWKDQLCRYSQLGCFALTLNVPVFVYGAVPVRSDFDAGKSISRAIGKGGP